MYHWDEVHITGAVRHWASGRRGFSYFANLDQNGRLSAVIWSIQFGKPFAAIRSHLSQKPDLRRRRELR